MKTPIPQEHFILFCWGIYKRLEYLLNDKKGQREIIQNNKLGWNTFVHLLTWGMGSPHRINDGKNRPHGYINANGIIWLYSEYHAEHVLAIFKKLDLIKFYYFGKETKLKRTNLNKYTKENDLGKIVPYDRIFTLKQMDRVEFEYLLKTYSCTNEINLNPVGLLA